MVQTEMGGARNIILDCLKKCRNSRKLVLVIVAVALLLDNMLLSTVVPIIPSFLLEIHHDERLAELKAHPPNDSSTTMAPSSTSVLGDVGDEPEMLLRKASFCSETEPPGPRLLIPISNQMKTTKLMESTTTESAVLTEAVLTTRTPQQEQERHDELVGENVEVGIMFASKPIVQALTNPFIGILTHRLGYTIPMFAGFVIMFISTIIFSLGKSYATLFMARSLQGVGSACTSVAGMGMLADLYPDDRERGNAMAVALGGLALGVLIGPPFGGVMYEFVGKSSPFLVLAALALFDGILQLFVLQPCVKREEQEGASIFTLIKDPYILIAAGAITFANMGIAILEPSLPLWMIEKMNSPKWEQGAAFLPASISYLIGTNVFGPLGHRIGRWLATLIGLVVIGSCLMLIPLATNFNHLITPNAGIGFAIGMVDSSMMPMLGHLVDIRHTSVYGSVYAIGDVAFCMGFAVGPALSGAIVKGIGFKGLVYCIAVFSFCYAPLMFFLRNPPGKEENQSLIMKESSIRYVTYTNEESPEEEKPPTLANNHTDWVK